MVQGGRNSPDLGWRSTGRDQSLDSSPSYSGPKLFLPLHLCQLGISILNFDHDYDG